MEEFIELRIGFNIFIGKNGLPTNISARTKLKIRDVRIAVLENLKIFEVKVNLKV